MWERRGERKRRRRRMKERGCWRDMRDDAQGDKHRPSKQERRRHGSEDEENAVVWERKRGEEPTRTERPLRAAAPTVQDNKAPTVAERSHGPADEGIYRISGALPNAQFFNPTQPRASTPYVKRTEQELPDTQPGSESSGRRSAYRALRAQERRAERARPYLPDPS